MKTKDLKSETVRHIKSDCKDFDDMNTMKKSLPSTEKETESKTHSNKAKNSVRNETMRIYEQYMLLFVESFLRTVRIEEKHLYGFLQKYQSSFSY